MDGYELANRIRQIPELHAARLFALTGYGQDSDRAQSQELGFEGHLAKPVEIETFRFVDPKSRSLTLFSGLSFHRRQSHLASCAASSVSIFGIT